jgi:outer membrane lipopolysaccharide assembly protein LptE/RlpB
MRGFVFLPGAVALLSGCGYHTLGSAAHLPATVHVLAVPIFKNQTQSYHSEVAMTQAVVREFTDRTRLAVTTDPDGADATVSGTIIAESVQPLTYRTETSTSGNQSATDTRPRLPQPDIQPPAKTSVTSSFLVTINVNVMVIDREHRILYRHTNYVFHEQFETTTDLKGFIEEDSPAVQRLSRDFAQALVSDILESF